VGTCKTMKGSTLVSDPTNVKPAIRYLQHIECFGTTGQYVQARNHMGVMFAV